MIKESIIEIYLNFKHINKVEAINILKKTKILSKLEQLICKIAFCQKKNVAEKL